MLRQSIYLVVGTIFAGLAYELLAIIQFPMIADAHVGVSVSGIVNRVFLELFLLRNTILLLLMLGLFIAGVLKRSWGVACSPLVFLALFFSTSVAQRFQVQRATDTALAERTAPENLRTIRTLIIESEVDKCCRQAAMLLANGIVDTYVHSKVDKAGRIQKIVAYRLGRKADCTGDDIRRSYELAKVGRTDECIRSEVIDAVPDGVVVRMNWMKTYPWGLGCCNQGTIGVRSAGVEQVVSSWYFGRRVVLSYFPLLGPLQYALVQTDPTGLWDAAPTGPDQIVQIGGPSFQIEDLAAAVYGVDGNSAVSPAQVIPRDLAQRAVALMQRKGIGERFPALDIAFLLQKQNYVDDDLLRVVASFIGYRRGSSRESEVWTYWDRLSEPNRRRFAEVVLTRLESLEETQGPGGFDWSIPPSLRRDFPDLAPRAEAAFLDRRDLAIWQYALALQMSRARLGSQDEDSQRHKYFLGLADDTTDAFARRAIAFKYVYAGIRDEECPFFSRRVDVVPDRWLREYLMRTRCDGIQLGQELTKAMQEARMQALARIDGIKDEALRRSLLADFGVVEKAPQKLP